jgi:hypothetical protein
MDRVGIVVCVTQFFTLCGIGRHLTYLKWAGKHIFLRVIAMAVCKGDARERAPRNYQSCDCAFKKQLA